jgi:hypothetical protein
MKRLVFLLVIFVSLNIFGQEQILFENTTIENYVLKYKPSNDPSQQVINYLLNTLATNRNRQYTPQVTFQHKQNLMVSRSGSNLTIEMKLYEFACKDAMVYRDFSICEPFIPESFSCDLVFKRKIDRDNIEVYKIRDQQIDVNQTIKRYNRVDTTNYKNFQLFVESLEFNYNEKNRQRLEQKIGIIDYYYDVSSRLNMAMNDLHIMAPNNIDLLPNYQQTLMNISGMIAEIENQQLVQFVINEGHDPLRFQIRFQELKTVFTQKQQAVQYTLSILHEIYYNRAMEMIVNNKPLAARNLLMKSLEANPGFAPALLQLAKLDYNEGYIDDAAIKITDLFQRLNPDPNTFSLGLELCENIYNSYLYLTSQFIGDEQFEKALYQLNKTIDFCSGIRDFGCSDQINVFKRDIHTGIYHQKLDEVEQLINAEELNKAEEKLKIAESYMRAHQGFVEDGGRKETLLIIIKNKQYKLYITFGKHALDGSNYYQAFDYFKLAKELENQYPLENDNRLPDFLRQSVKPIILADLQQGQQYVKSNELEKAREIVKKAMSLQSEYGLMEDPNINPLVDQLKSEILTQECINAQNEYDKLFADAEIMIYEKSFIDAEKTLINAISISSRYPDCGIDVSKADNKKLEILPAATYLKLLNKSNDNIRYKMYDKAITQYLLAERHFYQQEVAKFGLVHEKFDDFIQKQDNGFMVHTLTYYTNRKELDKTLGLMSILKSRNYKNKYIKEEQQRLGEELAINDYKENQNLDPKVSVNQYTSGDKYYKYLYRSYKKKYKKLVKGKS